jgi:hypothetical protein
MADDLRSLFVAVVLAAAEVNDPQLDPGGTPEADAIADLERRTRAQGLSIEEGLAFTRHEANPGHSPGPDDLGVL